MVLHSAFQPSHCSLEPRLQMWYGNETSNLSCIPCIGVVMECSPRIEN